MECVQVRAGRPVTEAVAAAIAASKAGDALREVHVIVASNLVGLSLRRMLGSALLERPGAAPIGPRGIANVSFSTPFQYASLLAAPTLAARGVRPLTSAVLAAAVRHTLATSPGRFGSVAEHVATESALIRAYAEVTEMPVAGRRALAASPTARTRDLIEFIDAVGAHLESGTDTSYHDEFAVLEAAAHRLGAAPPDAPVVVVGPFSQGQASIEFLAAVATHVPTRVVLALTGDDDVDAASREQMQSLGARFASAPPTVSVQPTRVVSAADSDEEVRITLRAVLDAAERGVPFDRIGVFVPAANPYLRMVRTHFDAAGVPTAGPDHRTLADSMTGRLLGRLVDLASSALGQEHRRRFGRETILALCAAAPLRGPSGERLRTTLWEGISRSAGVVSGLDDWRERLDAHSRSLTERIDRLEREGASAGQLAGLGRERAATIALGQFVEWLATETSPGAVGQSWSERAAWARTMLAALLPSPSGRARWPEAEAAAFDRIDSVLSRVAVLDDVEPELSMAAFERAIRLELDVPAGRRGRFGEGVLVAPLVSAVGLDLDEVFVLGMAEGLCPRPMREDTLLPDAERALTNGALAQRADRNRAERERYLHAVAAAGANCTLVTPRGDHRSGRDRTASRWFVEAVRNLTGDHTVSSQDWHACALFVDEQHGSFAQSLTDATRRGDVVSPADLQLQYVLARTRLGAAVPDEHVDPDLVRSLDMIRTRLGGFTRFTGDLSGVEVTSPIDGGRAISPSRLETWASCPRRYYFENVLRLTEIDRPEEIVEISALDRGSLVHEILELFIAEAVPGGPRALRSASQRWTDADRQRLLEIAEEVFARYEDLGRTGRAVLWAIRKEETRGDLEVFLGRDEELRDEHGCIPHEVELPFGLAGVVPDRTSADPAVVTLPDGRSIGLRGLIDRVDRTDDGTPVVLDYKTGKALGQREFDRDPIRGGQSLQLGVYAEAVRQHYGTFDAQAHYWYITDKGGFKTAGYEWTPARRERFMDGLETIVGGIEGGIFPPNPGDFNGYYGTFQNCSFCPFSRICPVDRDEELERAIDSGRLVDYVAMRDHEADSETGGEGS